MGQADNRDFGGLYRPAFEHDSCGFGMICQMDGVASHELVQTAVQALSRLTHRGAVAADGKSGDGCGLLMQLPQEYFRAIAEQEQIELSEEFAVGMVFLSRDLEQAGLQRQRLQAELEKEALAVAGWRVVPTDTGALGDTALQSLPRIEQVFVNVPDATDVELTERKLFIARRLARKFLKASDTGFHIVTLSTRLICYKGLVMPHNLPLFYPDLSDPRMQSSICIFHQRFSTNTWPEWRLAQPFRYLAHNGEINTIQGNRNWALARSRNFESPLIPGMKDIRPWVSLAGSDSYSLDNMLEALTAGGMSLFKAMRLLIPRAWQNDEQMDPDLRAFYEYHAMHLEAWDGPAGIVLTDGRYAVCTMDRNGLRPARYVVSRDRIIALASEAGVMDIPPEAVVQKGRLGPGDMLAIDTHSGELLSPAAIEDRLKAEQPYRQWLEQHARHLVPGWQEGTHAAPLPAEMAPVYNKMFQVTREEVEQILRPLAEAGQEASGSMGDDTPLPVLSRRSRSPYDYFRQQFAQVTNPPIDPLREQRVMSLQTAFGQERNIFVQDENHARRMVVESPVLSPGDMEALLSQSDDNYRHERIELNVDAAVGLNAALRNICYQAERAVWNGATLLVLSDRALAEGRLPVHAALATGAIHHHLVNTGLRCRANLLVETGTARNPHEFAVLVGFGATAVYPYLAYHNVAQMALWSDSTEVECRARYRRGINKGLYKILSKMGISTITSYRGAQLFEAVGLASEVVNLCFSGVTCRIEGSTFSDLETTQRQLAAEAWDPLEPLQSGGYLKYVHGGEYHGFNPDVVQALRTYAASGDPADYRRYSGLVNGREPMVLRDLLALHPTGDPLPVDQVEPVEAIVRRFETGAMSLGALSPEAHEALAVAMNRLGGLSNSGEGGEAATRFGTEKMSRVKQVASGRFGVTPHYLVNAEVLQIKVAQGAKPGEGGQLPGTKVDRLIAELRYALPGTTLISPPPHHDIYSIEDLAQLIFDLKQVNPQARVSVKLVSEAGVGTIAAGVAKAYADNITIAGYDGGTGASPLSSVKYAGSPWELGLRETHLALRGNQLRDRVSLQVDGGMKTGLDVIKAAILGAETFGFGTVALISLGCKYLRICHLNNCATGVATQDRRLRQDHFKGTHEGVIRVFQAIAQEVRAWLAFLGVPTLDEVVGRTELLKLLPGATMQQQRLDLSPLLSNGGVDSEAPHRCLIPRNDSFDRGELAERMLADMQPSIVAGRPSTHAYTLNNANRSIGARVSGVIARYHGNSGLESTPLTVRLTGTAGQSFGVWNAGGLHLYLEGEANDYVGKGMAGGRIVISPPPVTGFRSNEHVIIGNTCLYGDTGGTLYAAGIAGERFGVRNSGATAVVEGVGDHCCEYMTGGIVTVLGTTGVNFGAGMTGGFAFVLDLDGNLARRCNAEFVDLHGIADAEAEPHRRVLHTLLTEFAAETGSAWAGAIITDFPAWMDRFKVVKPRALAFAELVDSLHTAA
jgi:glutamate synthase (NADPH/NADH) large chain